ncbi:MAG: kynureninase [Frankiaceae bacterium]|nr:kynureninase [Frankiaceae bacterium]MDX6224860.1 kynureninase [Frankiales bacterium]
MEDFRARAEELDAADPLRELRDQFVIADPGLIYLDGNSLGRLPKASQDRLSALVDVEWGQQLIRGWHDWIDLPERVGDALGTALLGVAAGQVLVCDNTTVNLYKLALAATQARPGRTVIVTDDDNFPTDRYVLSQLATQQGLEVRTVATPMDDGVQLDAVKRALDQDVALVSFSHTAYRSGALAPMSAIDEAAHSVGALTLWDLSHSVGAVPVDLSRSDLAVGCSYKYLNGGPGAPAWLYVRRDLQTYLGNPIAGWFSQRDQFAMGEEYSPRQDVGRFLTGTPPILGLVCVEEGVRVLAEAGLERLRAKGVALTEFLIELADAWLVEYGVRVATPRDPDRRGSHIVLEHPQAWQLAQALIAAGVIPDYREPNRLRLGPAPAYTRFADVCEGLDRLRTILRTESHTTLPARPTSVR